MAKGISSGTRSGHWIPWIFVGAFLVVFAVNAVMVWFALNTFTGVTTADHYEEGLRANERIDAARRQDALGWNVETEFDRVQPERVALVARDAEGRPLTGATASALAIRPTHEGKDFEVEFVETSAGRYVGATSFPLPGQWELRFDLQRDGSRHRMIERVIVP